MQNYTQDGKEHGPSLIAYQVSQGAVRLVPAPSIGPWMNETTEKFANRCLPLKIANQASWGW